MFLWSFSKSVLAWTIASAFHLFFVLLWAWTPPAQRQTAWDGIEGEGYILFLLPFYLVECLGWRSPYRYSRELSVISYPTKCACWKEFKTIGKLYDLRNVLKYKNVNIMIKLYVLQTGSLLHIPVLSGFNINIKCCLRVQWNFRFQLTYYTNSKAKLLFYFQQWQTTL